MFFPYPYESDCLTAIAKVRQGGSAQALVVMASGLGKTVTAALDAKRWFKHHGGRLLYLCHQNDILEQARITFEAILGNSHKYGFLNGRTQHLDDVTCLFASFQTMRTWREDFSPEAFSYIVVDESHHGPAPHLSPDPRVLQARIPIGHYSHS